MQWQIRSNRKKTGGKLKRNMKKKRYQRGRDYLPVHIGKTAVKTKRTKGGSEKRILQRAEMANVIKGNKAQKVKIISVLENRADSQFVRRNIITKGAIIETELGKARVTSKPGQEGVINARIIEEK